MTSLEVLFLATHFVQLAMPRQWFIKTQNGQHGPISSKRLAKLARNGTLTPNTGISSDGESWVKAKKVAGLSFDNSDVDSKRKRRSKSRDWYIQTKNNVHGPFSHRRLQKLAKRGRIEPNVAISRDKKRWFKAKRIPGLEFSQNNKMPVAELKATPFVKIALPVIQELPIAGSLPSITDLPTRYTLPFPLPVINDLPISGPIPNLSDLPRRKRNPVALPVVDELPIDGRLPTLADLPPRISFPISLPVVDELPIDGRLPTLADLPPRISFPISLPVVDELPIDGRLPTLADLPPRKREPIALPVIDDLPIDGDIPTFESWLIGQQTKTNQQFAGLRQSQYIRHFGALAHVSRGDVDVCLHPPNSVRSVGTLVTCGMSNHAMSVPAGEWSPRAELVMYIDPNKMHANYIELLRSLAMVPQNAGRGFWYGCTMANGSPAKMIFAGSELSEFLFMIPNIRSDFQIRQSLSIDDKPVQLLWVVPITTMERRYLRQHGMQAFCQLLDQNGHHLTLDPNRKCFVTGGRQQVG